jgi:HAD superfamily hydrolase (TIGR01457 family)
MAVLAERYACFLLDLDGTLYLGEEALPNAVEAVAKLRDLGKAVVFMTNNSARTGQDVAEKLRGLGFAADPGEVVTSASVTASMLAGRGTRSAFVVGGRGIRDALSEVGVEVLTGEPARADCVVIGLDTEVDYSMLRTACLLVEKGAALVGTNRDAAFPTPTGSWPGAGALLAVVVTTTGVEPEVAGKPEAPIFLASLDRAGGGIPLVVGDRLDTDIQGAGRLGWDSLLVLTGIADRASLEVAAVKPTFVGDDLAALFEEAPNAAG